PPVGFPDGCVPSTRARPVFTRAGAGRAAMVARARTPRANTAVPPPVAPAAGNRAVVAAGAAAPVAGSRPSSRARTPAPRPPARRTHAVRGRTARARRPEGPLSPGDECPDRIGD